MIRAPIIHVKRPLLRPLPWFRTAPVAGRGTLGRARPDADPRPSCAFF